MRERDIKRIARTVAAAPLNLYGMSLEPIFFKVGLSWGNLRQKLQLSWDCHCQFTRLKTGSKQNFSAVCHFLNAQG
ncbi:hypothetical protein B0G71_6962 [Paraburkholderia sp. BL27I4N3]|uniref:hypothetical protein n=1 Tax=Paraburkholderia sp. BL27I4N3 TaxID=1938805 RepID=UPI000E2275B1|nr:hypothetical protein [Paraburkholderia sp. BL27I4N3]REE23681.1 hypothetical protein B0G71_6962 [Paraburkholderia sp. BL27I4N3]